MDAPAFRAVPGYDVSSAAAAVGQALAVPGGADLVISSLGRLPGSLAVAGRGGRFRAQPASVQIGQWRYTTDGRGRLAAAHVVGEIVIGEDLLPVIDVGPHVAGALGQYLADVGPHQLPEVLAMIEGLAVATA